MNIALTEREQTAWAKQEAQGFFDAIDKRRLVAVRRAVEAGFYNDGGVPISADVLAKETVAGVAWTW